MMEIKEKKSKKVIFTKSGRGSINTRVSLPVSWIKEMGITEDNKEIVAILTADNKIILEKKKN